MKEDSDAMNIMTYTDTLTGGTVNRVNIFKYIESTLAVDG